MAIIVEAPCIWAAITDDNPTDPVPKTTKDDPFFTGRAFMTAPAPVRMPQPRGPSKLRSTVLGTLTVFNSRQREKVAKDDCPKKLLCTGLFSFDNAVVPSSLVAPKLRGINS